MRAVMTVLKRYEINLLLYGLASLLSFCTIFVLSKFSAC